jgi:hypothetical protein
VRWFATLFVAGCHFGDGVPVKADAASDAPADMTLDAPGMCPNGYTQSGPVCYRVLSAQSTWPSARMTCQASQADLAWPPDAAALQAMTVLEPNRDFWIGIYDPMNTGVYITVDGSMATFTPWGNGEPKSPGQCVQIHQQNGMHVFVTQSCNINLAAICDVPAM